VLIALTDRVNREQISDPALLLPEARERLAGAQSRVKKLIERNVFLREDGTSPPAPVPSAPDAARAP
jgi:arabinosaccharide transport system substrate-binding protein